MLSVYGLFDSGSGGLNTVRYVKELYPDIDLVYLIDRENSPYGIKTEKEIIKITENNIRYLKDMGAERVLIACCTASTVWDKLKEEYKALSIPIIDAVALAAEKATRNGRIGVIATERTVNSHSFKKRLPKFKVYEKACGELVGMIDGGINDQTAAKNDIAKIDGMLSCLYGKNIDTLILGCTHFPALEKTISELAYPHGIKSIVNSARIGADLLNAYNVNNN